MYLPKPNESQGDYTPPPAGTHAAICTRVIDLGSQDTNFGVKHQVMLMWELPEELMTDGRPFIVSQKYTWSMSEKATLRKHLESWRGVSFKESDFGEGGFDIKNILGVGCLLNIINEENKNTGKTYSKVTGVSKLPKSMTTGTPSNQTVYFSLSRFDAQVLNELPEWMRNMIKSSPEYGQLMGVDKRVSNDEYDDRNPPPVDEVPF